MTIANILPATIVSVRPAQSTDLSLQRQALISFGDPQGTHPGRATMGRIHTADCCAGARSGIVTYYTIGTADHTKHGGRTIWE